MIRQGSIGRWRKWILCRWKGFIVVLLVLLLRRRLRVLGLLSHRVEIE